MPVRPFPATQATIRQLTVYPNKDGGYLPYLLALSLPLPLLLAMPPFS